jgi:parallel beta-helix repeat protein
MTITNFAYGVVYSYGEQTGFYGSVDNILLRNTIANNSQGIICYLTGGINVSANIIMNEDVGIHGIMANSIFVYENTFSDNVRGIQLDGSDAKVYGNNFINNTFHVKLDPDQNVNGLSGSAVSWDNGSSGNYWSSYDGIDVDGNGIGDIPYIVDINSRDLYPLMAPVKLAQGITRLNEESKQTSEPFPIVLVIATVAAVTAFGVGLLAYFKKRKSSGGHS